jgi:D-tyrosyl-tRNA(Tyr) deacylase
VRAVVQRVSRARVIVEGATVGAIDGGLLVYLGVAKGDAEPDRAYIVDKVANLRVFEDDAGKMNRSVRDAGGSVLVVSQFTLYGDARKGRRPSFDATMFRYVIRGATPDDAPQMMELARHLNTVNLPNDPEAVAEILDLSMRSFSGAVKDPRRREFVFVIEDLLAQRIIGTSKILAQLGRRDAPYIFLDVIVEEKYSHTLDRHFVHTLLRLGHSYEGPTEIGGLIVLPEFRLVPERVGMMISYVRFLFMAMHRGLFRNEVVAELLPPLLPDGTSHLWEALGRKFTDMSYSEADRLSKRNKEFIKSLFPTGDIYASLLPHRRPGGHRQGRAARPAASRRCCGASASSTATASTPSTAGRTSARPPTRSCCPLCHGGRLVCLPSIPPPAATSPS